MTTSTTTAVAPDGTREFRSIRSGTLRLSRSSKAQSIVVEFSTGRLVLTREEAADLAEALHDFSGLQTSSYAAPYLAAVHRDRLAAKGITRTRLACLTGITRYRLHKILNAEAPMSVHEHRAISEAQA